MFNNLSIFLSKKKVNDAILHTKKNSQKRITKYENNKNTVDSCNANINK